MSIIKRKSQLKSNMKIFLLFVLTLSIALATHSETNQEKKSMEKKRHYINEKDIEKSVFADRWSKDLINEKLLGTTAGFSLGVAEYPLKEFGEPGVHEDQEAIYIISGYGEYMLGDEIFPVSPGCAVYIPAHTKHGVRCTTDEPVKLIYAHASVE